MNRSGDGASMLEKLKRIHLWNAGRYCAETPRQWGAYHRIIPGSELSLFFKIPQRPSSIRARCQ